MTDREAGRPAATGARLVRVATAGLGLAAALMVLPAVPVAAAGQPGARTAAGEFVAVPADGVFHLEGHGFGHGHGLNQWGAQGAARSGVDAATILAHYHPGTTAATAAPRSLRVLLSGGDPRRLTVAPAPGLAVTDAAGPRTQLPAGPAYASWRVDVGPDSFVLSTSDGTTWHPVGPPLAGPVRFDTGAGTVRVGLADGTARDYRGALSAVRTGPAALATVNTVSIEDYLRGVVPRESPAGWAPAALQAQAVAARTYASYLADHAAPGRPYDLCDTDACQVYGGVRRYSAAGVATTLEQPATDAAVAATAGQVRLYAGVAAFTQFSASSGGWTVPGSAPYLPAAPDPWDAGDPANPVHSWTAALPAAALAAQFPAVGRLTALQVTARDGNGDWGGRVLTVTLRGAAPDGSPTAVATTGAAVAAVRGWPGYADGIRSTWWHVTSPGGPAPPPPALTLSSVRPRTLLTVGRVAAVAPRRVAVAGTRGVPRSATAARVLVLASVPAGAGGDVLAWASGGPPTGAVRLARVRAGAPVTGTRLVPLGPDGALLVAAPRGARLRVTLLGSAAPAPPAPPG